MSPKRSIAALRALCALKLHPEVLIPAVLEALHGLVPSYRNLFDWTDEEGRLVRYFIEGPVDADIARLYFDEFHNRREAEAMPAFHTLHRAPPGVRGADELDHPAFYRSALYNEIWRPQGFLTRLEAVVRGPGSAAAARRWPTTATCPAPNRPRPCCCRCAARSATPAPAPSACC